MENFIVRVSLELLQSFSQPFARRPASSQIARGSQPAAAARTVADVASRGSANGRQRRPRGATYVLVGRPVRCQPAALAVQVFYSSTHQ